MDLHSVKLKFEAFVERNGFREQIGLPEYSHAIHNLSKFLKVSKSNLVITFYLYGLWYLESTHAGDLRIVRIDKVYSCCTGQEEIFIFVEKVNKSKNKFKQTIEHLNLRNLLYSNRRRHQNSLLWDRRKRPGNMERFCRFLWTGCPSSICYCIQVSQQILSIHYVNAFKLSQLILRSWQGIL